MTTRESTYRRGYAALLIIRNYRCEEPRRSSPRGRAPADRRWRTKLAGGGGEGHWGPLPKWSGLPSDRQVVVTQIAPIELLPRFFPLFFIFSFFFFLLSSLLGSVHVGSGRVETSDENPNAAGILWKRDIGIRTVLARGWWGGNGGVIRGVRACMCGRILKWIFSAAHDRRGWPGD